MKALVFDKQLRLENDRAIPAVPPGWALIRVSLAGICRTDIEICRGYMGFSGIPGHEFVGTVEQCDDASWVGARVVGEINAACGTCEVCAAGLGRHCPNRRTLGIDRLDGCFAEYCALPTANLYRIPDDVTDEEAVFTEPLSAACEILHQVELRGDERCVVIGDGKLGILCAWALATKLKKVDLLGHHEDKLSIADAVDGVQTHIDTEHIQTGADLVVEASGSVSGFTEAMHLCRPRGTLILKSTIASMGELNLAPVVIDELTVIGSRCGLFEWGLDLLHQHTLPIEQLISARYPLEEGVKAFEASAQAGILKVVLEV
jgi:alcohol dehydrogenase